MEEKSIIKIALIGPESTGKSSLAAQLAEVFGTVYVPEYARLYFNEHNIHDYTLADLDIIYRRQMEEEAAALKSAQKVLFADTMWLTGKIWALEVFSELPPLLKDETLMSSYDFYLLCDIDLPWVEDEQRKNPHNREYLFKKHLEELKRMQVPFETVSGFHQARLNNAVNAVRKYLESIADPDV